MNLIKEKIQHFTPKWLIILLAIFFILFIILTSAILTFEQIYKGKIYPGIMIGENDFSGLTKEEARNKINKKINEYDQKGIIFKYNEQEKNILPTESSFAGDFIIQIFSIDAEKTIDKLYNTGRDKNFWTNWKRKIKNIFNPQKISVEYEINKDSIEKSLKEKFGEFETEPLNAGIQFIKIANSDEKKIIITEEQKGEIINYQKGIKMLKNNLENLSSQKIILISQKIEPAIYKKELKNIKEKINKTLSNLPFVLQAEDEKWNMTKETIIPLITLTKKNGNIEIAFDKEKLSAYLEQNVGSIINISPQDAKFEIVDGVVTIFKPHQKGIELDLEKSIAKIQEDFFVKQATSTNLIIKEAESKIKIGEINNLGIKEIIGTGHSNFSGSPANRIHNINNGSKSVSGTLIEPGGEFSLVNVLGEVNAKTGYLPELVIKDNETVPEYGGGLCQVATTLFRGALNSGLEITERRNHSYRVSYYEPAGTDATVYIPRPDLKFKNNTNHHILIQYRISGTNLYFDFWGTKDGRTIEIDEPTIYNIVSPPPTKLIETLDLEPGKKKCTERAHNGADAYFDYKVTYTDGKIWEERFSSHYIPWQEVCLIGVEELSPSTSSKETTEDTAKNNIVSSTNETE